MNYFEKHIGDYLKDTAHLSLLEHGVYNRLFDVYYTREGGIPASDAARLIGARTKDERQALQSVLAEFFVLRDGLHIQERCDREIERYQGKQAKAKASADARWGAQRTQSERNANASSEHDTSADAPGMRTHSEGNAPRARPQTPVTRHQKEKKEPNGSSSARPTIPCPYQAIVELYHDRLPSLPKVKLMPKARQTALRKLWGWVLSSSKTDGTRRAETAEQALEWIGGYFARASENDFLMGRTPRNGEHANWRCDLDFLLTDRGMRHVIEKTQEHAA